MEKNYSKKKNLMSKTTYIWLCLIFNCLQGLTTTTSAHPNKHQLPFNQNISPEVKLRSARHNQLPPYQSPMASATLIHPSSLSHTSSPLPTVSRTYPFIASLSNTALSFSYPKNQILRSITFVPQTGLASFSSWNGLRHNGFSISLKSLRFGKFLLSSKLMFISWYTLPPFIVELITHGEWCRL